jgi:D-alanine-D-alanine ligase
VSKSVLALTSPASPVADALRDLGYALAVTDGLADIAGRVSGERPDFIFNDLSFPDARNGRLQGVLELEGVPYTHSGVLASALAADRHQTKIMLRAAGLPVADHVVVERFEAAREHALPPPYVIKPMLVGLSAPVLIARSARDLPPDELLRPDWRGGDEVMVERFLPGLDIDVAIMGGVALGASVVEKSQTSGAERDDETRKTPEISLNIYEKVQKMGLKANDALGCRGVTRISFRYNPMASGDTGLVCIGVDTQPALVPGSLLARQAEAAGHSFADLVGWIAEDASCNR